MAAETDSAADGTAQEGNRVMLSGRFDGGPKEAVIRGVAARLKALIGNERVLIVNANAGDHFTQIRDPTGPLRYRREET